MAVSSQKHAKSAEFAIEFLLHAATVIFKEQVEKAFREGTARRNAHIMFVSLALNLLEERVMVTCKDIITLEKHCKFLEEEEKEKRDEKNGRNAKGQKIFVVKKGSKVKTWKMFSAHSNSMEYDDENYTKEDNVLEYDDENYNAE
ncbi:uncharacterized protein [Rutidosis leptorrhynchoides]|uniref:uncharacterized protein n=1 Tax=Rutidosis leptorrhynchoides TaxID=125765 RepID=UPI003A999B8E